MHNMKRSSSAPLSLEALAKDAGDENCQNDDGWRNWFAFKPTNDLKKAASINVEDVDGLGAMVQNGIQSKDNGKALMANNEENVATPDSGDINLITKGTDASARRPSNVRQDSCRTFTEGVFDLKGQENFEFSITVPSRKVNRDYYVEEAMKNLGFDVGIENNCRNKDEEGDCQSVKSEVSEITFMTYKAENAQREISKLKALKKQKKVNDVKKKDDGLQSEDQQEEGLIKSFQKSIISMMETNLNSNLSSEINIVNDFIDEEKGVEDDGADEFHDDSSGALHVGFGSRPISIKSKMSRESPEVKSYNEDLNQELTPGSNETKDSEVRPEAAGQDVDALVELKLQLAQKQSVIDELASNYHRVMREKARLEEKLELSSRCESSKRTGCCFSEECASLVDSLARENASLKNRLRKLQAVLTEGLDLDLDQEPEETPLHTRVEIHPLREMKSIVQQAPEMQAEMNSVEERRTITSPPDHMHPNIQLQNPSQSQPLDYERRRHSFFLPTYSPEGEPIGQKPRRLSQISADAYGKVISNKLDDHFVSLSNSRKEPEPSASARKELDSSSRSFFTALTMSTVGSISANGNGRRKSAASRRSSGRRNSCEGLSNDGPETVGIRRMFQRQTTSRW